MMRSLLCNVNYPNALNASFLHVISLTLTVTPRVLPNVEHTATLQSSAAHCNTLLPSGVTILLSCMPRYNTLQYIATHCNSLKHTATHCNTLQHTATHCNTMQHRTHSRCGNSSGSLSVTTVVSAHLPRPPPPPHHDSYSGHETPYQVCVCVCDVKDVY